MMVKSCLLTIAFATSVVVWDVQHLVAAQEPERPANCTEAMDVGTIFIGHDCGDVADVLISGRVVIRRPWSHVTSASRSERLRIARGGAVAPPPAATPPPVTAAQLAAPEAIPSSRSRAKQRLVAISLDCASQPETTTITNNGPEAITVNRMASRTGPAVVGEETLPAIDLVIPPGESRTVETGPGADPATGGIADEIFNDDRLDVEGVIVKTTAGTFRRSCRS